MKKILCMTISFLSCLMLVACSGNNYPGKFKDKYWLSEDEKMMFWFPAEAGVGNAQGIYVKDENTKYDLLLEWDTNTGIVEVKTSGYEKVFIANTTTNATKLECTFEITLQEENFDFPSIIKFIWKENVVN